MSTGLSGVKVSPDAFAMVMATGILSIGARNLDYPVISEALGVLASVALVALVVLVAAIMVAERRIAVWDLADPDVTLRLFTFVAACAVLDSRLAAHPVVVRILGVVALLSWLVLTVLTVRNMASRSWVALRDHAHGAWLLASVGTSGLVIVMAQVAIYTGHRVWLAVAVPIWAVALVVYCLMAWLILWRTLHERIDRDGFEPDTWILMGGLAIATLAGDYLHELVPDRLADGVRAVTVVTWVLGTVWIPPLIYFVLHRINHRPALLRFRGVWWTLVFPLGMYSVASFAMAVELSVPELKTVSLMFFWNALTAWLIVIVAGLLRALRSLRARAISAR